MDINQLLGQFNLGGLTASIFKIIVILLSVIYLLYSIVIQRQVKVMGKTLDTAFNQFIFLVSSVQIAVAFILLIFSIFLI